MIILETQRIDKDSIAVVRISVSNLPTCHAYDVQLTYDQEIVRCKSVRELQFFPGQTFFSALNDSTNGRVNVDEALLGTGGQSGSGDIAELKFVSRQNGSTALSFSNADFRDLANQPIVVTRKEGSIQVGRSTGVKEVHKLPLSGIVVRSCYPNPFNPSTTILYNRGDAGYARVRIFSLLGEEVFCQFQQYQDQGEQTFVWHGRDQEGQSLATGIYLVQIETANNAATTKVLLVG